MLIQSLALDASFSGDLVWSFHPRAVRPGPGRSQEVRASPELQNGGLRALGEAWTTSSWLRHLLVKSDRFLWPLVISKCLRLEAGGMWRQREVQGNPELPNGGLRALGKAWTTSCRLRHLCFCGRIELVEKGLTLSREFLGGAGKASAPEQWAKSSGRGVEQWLLLRSRSISNDKLGCCYCCCCCCCLGWELAEHLDFLPSSCLGDLNDPRMNPGKPEDDPRMTQSRTSLA